MDKLFILAKKGNIQQEEFSRFLEFLFWLSDDGILY